MKGRIREDVPDEDYFADPSFSQSRAKVLLESPAKYRWQLTQPVTTSDAFDVGHVVHAKVLGVGLPVWVIDAEDWKKPVHRAERDAARSYGFTPMLREQHATTERMAEAVLTNTAARAALEAQGDVELSMWWTDPDSQIDCKGRVDKAAATDAGTSLVDLKSAADGSPRGFTSSAAKYGYRLQGGAYCDGWDCITGERPAGFLFITVETDAPHLVATYSLTEWDIDAGRAKWREACARLADYRARDLWPAYATELPDFAPLDLPAWAV